MSSDQLITHEVLYPIMFCSRALQEAAADLFFSLRNSTEDFVDLPDETEVMVHVQV